MNKELKPLIGTLGLVAAVMAAHQMKAANRVIRRTSDSKEGRRLTQAKGSKVADKDTPNLSEEQKRWNHDIETRKNLKRMRKESLL